MKKLVVSLGILILSLPGTVFAHEGHDKTPGVGSAPHGVGIKGTEQLYIELVNETGGIKIYPLTHDLAAVPLKDVSLEATATFPKKPKAEPVVFTQAEDHFLAKVDGKGAYRYSLDLTVTYKGKKEKMKFQVEPQG